MHRAAFIIERAIIVSNMSPSYNHGFVGAFLPATREIHYYKRDAFLSSIVSKMK
jgi:hypothetical protein